MNIYKVLYLSDTDHFDTELMYMVDKLGYELIHSLDYEKSYEIYTEVKPDIILLDRGFSDNEVDSFIDYIREFDKNTPIIALYDINLENHIHTYFIDKTLEKDRFIKRFRDIEKNIFRIYEFENGITYNFNDKCFFQNKQILKLNNQESNLIEFLLKEPNSYHRYVTIQTVLSEKKDISIDSLRTLVKNIRKKTYSNLITNMSGHGYKINLKDETKIKNDDINILICDDQKSNVEFLSTLLNKHIQNLNIHKAIGGKEALEILKNEDINILLLDIHMPDISGWDVARYINKKLSDKNIATIFITSVYIDEEYQKEGFELGAVDYLVKPIDQNLLVNRLNLYIKNFKQERKILKEIEKSRDTEKKILQKEVMVAQSNVLEKMAHHWRQPLSLISSNASLIGLGIENDIDKNKIHEAVDIITSTTNNLSNLIDQFQSFFKPNSDKTYFNMKKDIHRIIQLMRFSFTNNRIKLKLDLDDVEFYGYENEFKQVIVSLLSNCVDILISQDIDKRFVLVKLKEHNENISISITDSGGGIDKNIEDKIYEPYFTTKHEYSGTGLSLHLSKEITQRYLNGNLMNKNVKTTFKNKEYLGAKFILNIQKS